MFNLSLILILIPKSFVNTEFSACFYYMYSLYLTKKHVFTLFATSNKHTTRIT